MIQGADPRRYFEVFLSIYLVFFPLNKQRAIDKLVSRNQTALDHGLINVIEMAFEKTRAERKAEERDQCPFEA